MDASAFTSADPDDSSMSPDSPQAIYPIYPEDITEVTLETVAFRVAATAAKIDAMQQTMDAILAKFDGIASEVGPVVDAISTHPLFKMIGGKR